MVRLSLRAWAPVFASMEEALGRELFGRRLDAHPPWRTPLTVAQCSSPTGVPASEVVGEVVVEGPGGGLEPGRGGLLPRTCHPPGLPASPPQPLHPVSREQVKDKLRLLKG